MSIWRVPFTLEQLNAGAAGTLVEHIGIEFLEIGDDYLRARMPVDHRTIQPAGILHGGASVVLAETLGSVAAFFSEDSGQKHCVGLEINANHVRSVSSGFVYGTARPLHIGSTTQLWDIRISNEHNQLVCVSRLTMAVIASRPDTAKTPEVHR
ncbi:MAG: hotdog fold thioesterase [Gammaproteobacteria bacterium]|nr:hotdog fold thioesterase [Gammaproteobacteria bacterium]MCP5458540.1 hotdog fold thioesterase [Gammaproteobacteria bacterium]